MPTPAEMPRRTRPRKYGGAIVINGQKCYRTETQTTVNNAGAKQKGFKLNAHH